MLRDVIIGQRKERDKLLSRQYLRRNTKYDLEAYLQSRQIKLITGPRRAGKSTEALLMLHDRNFAYLNFDNDELLGQWKEESIMGLSTVSYLPIVSHNKEEAVTKFATASSLLWTSQGLNLGPPDYENDKMIFCDSLLSQFLLKFNQLRISLFPMELTKSP